MSLGIDLRINYFIEQKHITDLEKLKDVELYYIIGWFRDELEKFNESEEFKLKGLITACNEMKDLIKDFRFILNFYIEEISNYNIRSIEKKEDIEQIMKKMKIIQNEPPIEEIKELLIEMNKIENILDKIKKVRLLKEKVDELANKCLYKMRIFYDSLGDFIIGEIYFWDKIDLKKEFYF